MECEKDKLIAILESAVQSIESGNNIYLQGTDSFLFKDGFVYSYNDITSIAIKLPKDLKNLSGCVKAKEFYQVITKLPNKKIMFSNDKDGKGWILKVGTCEIKLNFVESKMIDYIDELNKDKKSTEWSDLPNNFKDGIKKVKINRKYTTAVSGIFFSKEYMYSIDSEIINRCKYNGKIKDDFVLSENVLETLLKFDNINKYKVGKAWVHFIMNETTQVSCRSNGKTNEYPIHKIENLIENYTKNQSIIKTKITTHMVNAIGRTSIFSYENIDAVSIVKMVIENNTITFYGVKGFGSYKEKVISKEKIVGKSDSITVFFNADVAQLEIGAECSIKKSKENGIVYIQLSYKNYLSIISTFDPGKK